MSYLAVKARNSFIKQAAVMISNDRVKETPVTTCCFFVSELRTVTRSRPSQITEIWKKRKLCEKKKFPNTSGPYTFIDLKNRPELGKHYFQGMINLIFWLFHPETPPILNFRPAIIFLFPCVFQSLWMLNSTESMTKTRSTQVWPHLFTTWETKSSGTRYFPSSKTIEGK